MMTDSKVSAWFGSSGYEYGEVISSYVAAAIDELGLPGDYVRAGDNVWRRKNGVKEVE